MVRTVKLDQNKTKPLISKKKWKTSEKSKFIIMEIALRFNETALEKSPKSKLDSSKNTQKTAIMPNYPSNYNTYFLK